jgi:hypothetical protein
MSGMLNYLYGIGLRVDPGMAQTTGAAEPVRLAPFVNFARVEQSRDL